VPANNSDKSFPLDFGHIECMQVFFLLLLKRPAPSSLKRHGRVVWSQIRFGRGKDEDSFVEWCKQQIEQSWPRIQASGTGVDIKIGDMISKFLSCSPSLKELTPFYAKVERVVQILWGPEEDDFKKSFSKKANQYGYIEQVYKELRGELWVQLYDQALGKYNDLLPRLQEKLLKIKDDDLGDLDDDLGDLLCFQAIMLEALLKMDAEASRLRQESLFKEFDLSTGPLRKEIVRFDTLIRAHDSKIEDVLFHPDLKDWAVQFKGDIQFLKGGVKPSELSWYMPTQAENDLMNVLDIGSKNQPVPRLQGCYGVAGDRGTGKSTLLQKLEVLLGDMKPEILIVSLSIPRVFDDRNFLFAFLYELCDVAQDKLCAGWFRRATVPIVHFVEKIWQRRWWILLTLLGIYVLKLTDLEMLFRHVTSPWTRDGWIRVGQWVVLVLALLGVVVCITLLLRGLGIGQWLYAHIPEVQRLTLYLYVKGIMADLDTIRTAEEGGIGDYPLPFFSVTTEVNPMRYSIPLLSQQIEGVINGLSQSKIFGRVAILIDDLDKLTLPQAEEALKNFRGIAALSNCLVVISCPRDIFLQFARPSVGRHEADTLFSDMFLLEDYGEDGNGVRDFVVSRLLSPRFGKELWEKMLQPTPGRRVHPDKDSDESFWRTIGEQSDGERSPSQEKFRWNRREVVRIFKEIVENWLVLRTNLLDEYEVQSIAKKDDSVFECYLAAYERVHEDFSKQARQEEIRAAGSFKAVEPFVKLLTADGANSKGVEDLEKLSEMLTTLSRILATLPEQDKADAQAKSRTTAPSDKPPN